MDSSLYHYKENLKQALILVPNMSEESKTDAVKYWNDLAIQLQHIIFGSSNTNFGQEALNQNSQVRVGSSCGLTYSNSIIDHTVQSDTPITSSFSSPSSINSPSDSSSLKHDRINQFHSDNLIRKSIYENPFLDGSPISVTDDCCDHSGLKTSDDSLLPSNHTAYQMDQTGLSCQGPSQLSTARSDIETIPALTSNNYVIKSSTMLTQVPDHLTSSRTTIDLTQNLSNELVSQTSADSQMLNYLATNAGLDLSTTVLTKADHDSIETNYEDNLLVDVSECSSKSLNRAHDIGDGQFDRGPKGHYNSLSEYNSYYNPNAAMIIESSANINSYATPRNDSFTTSERPLQQIQVFNQASASSPPTSSTEIMSSYNILKFQSPESTDTSAQLVSSKIESIEPDTKTESIKLPVVDKVSNNTTLHTCEVCGKSGFSTKGNLKRHLRAHSGEKPFKCEFCESCFTEKKSLKIHVRRHTGEKPYKCQICGKLFSQTGVLQSHMALHLNERKFECNKCGKAFRQRSQLKLHLMRHDGVKRLECSTCMAKFLTKGDLERHCRIHTGERPYACKICSKTFTRQQSLNEHMNRHTGRKPYDCKFCDKTFSEMSACYKHAKVHKRQDQGQQLIPTESIPNQINANG